MHDHYKLIPAKKFPDPIKYKYVNKFYHEKESVVKIREFLQAFQKRNLIQGVSAYRPDRKAVGEKTEEKTAGF